MRAPVILALALGPALAVVALGAACSSFGERAPTPDLMLDGAGADGDPAADGGPDALVDTGLARCNPVAPFGAPRRIDELSTAVPNEWVARVSADERFVVFGRNDVALTQIFTATRSDPDASWSIPTEIAGPWGNALVGEPMLATLKGQPTLFFSEAVTGQGWDVQRISWDPALSTVTGQRTPVFATGASEVSPYFVEATDELWFLREVAAGVFRTYRDVFAAGSFSAIPAEDPVLSSAAYKTNSSLAFSPDGLTVFFGAWPNAATDTDVEIYTATRTSANASFTGVTRVVELSTRYFESPVTVTPDGCRLYFSSNRSPTGGTPTSIDLYVAQRGL